MFNLDMIRIMQKTPNLSDKPLRKRNKVRSYKNCIPKDSTVEALKKALSKGCKRKPRLISFTELSPSCVDRALKFMVSTGVIKVNHYGFTGKHRCYEYFLN